ncbi:efflux RND transporter periplasmic adaptor subunit [uncultured Abyssibacter sp.]|uniref:efflux RND transporter periplasmic adaptor subunit n=1 Tax=uncultured Abyssibacter sp. TaxID=2320202 RepID=UPI0032B24A15
MKRRTKVFAFFGIVILGMLILTVLVKTKPKPGRSDAGPVKPLVETVQLTAGTVRVEIDATGTVQAARDVQVTSEVGGRVEAVAPDFIPGGRVKAGDALIRLEAERFELAVDQARANLARARSDLALEQGRVEVAEREWTLFDRTDADGALARRKPQLAAARATVKSAEAQLRDAQLNLERSTITAPFDGVVQSESVEAGQVVNAGQQLGRLLGDDVFHVLASVPVDRLQWLPLPTADGSAGAAADIRQPNTTSARKGRVIRVLGDLDPEGRMARLLLEVPEPLSGPTPLLVGAFVDVALHGRELVDTIAIPRAALIGSNAVWRVNDDNALEKTSLTITWRSDDAVFIRSGSGGLNDGDRILKTRIPLAVEGMHVRIAGDDAPDRTEAGEPG